VGEAAQAKANRRITLSKQIAEDERIHFRYARLKISEQGEVVKVVVSK
jgi:hypothetical protein